MDENASEPRSRRFGWKKILLVALGAFALLLVVGAVALTLLFDPAKLRPQLERKAEEALGREVRLGELGLSFFPGVGVTIDGLSVEDGQGGEMFSAKNVRVGASLVPLIGGRLEIGRVVLEEPEVVIRRGADGRFELQELLGGKGEKTGEARVSVRSVAIRGGHATLEDASVMPGQVVKHELRDLDLTLDGLDELDRPVRVKLDARVPSLSPEARVSWDGRVSRALTGSGRLELEALELAPLAAHASALGGRDLSALAGRIDADLELSRPGDGALGVEGEVEARELVLPRAGAAAVRLPDLRAELGLEARPGGETIVERFDFGTGDTTLSAQGRLSVEEDARTLVLEVEESSVRLADLRALAKAAGRAAVLDGLEGEDLRIGGRLRLVLGRDDTTLRRLDVDGLRVRNLGLSVARDRQGRFDFQRGSEAKTSPAKAATRSFQVSARDVEVSGVDVTLRDAAIGNGQPVVTTVRKLELRIDQWVPGKTTPVRLSGSLAGGTATIEGRAGPIEAERLPVDLRVKLDGLDVAALAPYLKRYAGLVAQGGTLDADTRLVGDKAKSLQVKGRLVLDEARVEIPGRGVRELDLSLDHDLTVEGGGDRVKLQELTVGLPGGPASFDGVVEMPDGGSASFDVGTRGPVRLTTQDLEHLIALTGAETGVRLEAQEPIVLDARLRRQQERFSVQGEVELRKLIVRHALLGDTPLQVATADVALAGDRVAMNGLRLRLGESDLAGRLSLQGFERHRVDFDLSSETADLDELFAFVGRFGGGATEGASKSGGGGRALDRTTAEGRLRVGRATWGGLQFQDFDATVRLADRRLSVARSRVGLYGGDATAELALDLASSPASYEANGELTGVKVHDLLKAGVGYGELEGVGGGRFRLAGRAGSPEAALRAVAGQGNLALTDGVLGGLNVLEALKRAEVFGERSLAELGARLAEEGTSFERLDADYEIGNGILQLKRVNTRTPEAAVFAKGPVRLLDRHLDLDVDVTFSKELSARMREEGSRAARLFWNAREEAVRIPLKLVGSIAEPKAVIDWEGAVGQMAEAEIGRQLGGLLGGALGGRDRSPSQEPAESRATGESASGPEPTASATGPSVEIRRARFGGNFLVPDVKVEAVLSGRDLEGATVVLTDASGRELARDEQAFVSAVNAHYAAGASRSERSSIEVRWELDGERVAGKRDLQVQITPRTRGGEAGPTAKAPVAAKSLF